MADSIITIQELKDAQKYAKALGLIINSPTWQKIATRLDLDCYSIATVNALIEQIQAQGDEKLAELQAAIDELLASDNWRDGALRTWSGRTQEEKNKDSIHVLDFKKGKTDQEAIQDAVNYCLANNRTLDWDGAYLTSTGNISNMWDITHVGSGSVSRDGNTFYFNNASKESGLFINRNQNIITKFTNDGLSEAFPFQPYRINTFFDKFIELNGNYVFNFAAGAYTDASVHRIALGSDSETGKTIPQLSGYIVLKGASTGFNPLTNAIPVPTSVFVAEAVVSLP